MADGESSDSSSASSSSEYSDTSSSDSESKKKKTSSHSSTSNTHAAAKGSKGQAQPQRARLSKQQAKKEEPQLMALGLKKRDRRTIEEIQRDMKKKRPSSRPNSRPPSRATSPVLMVSPNSSPCASPAPSGSAESSDEEGHTKLQQPPAGAFKITPGGPRNSARSRLAKKVLGRKRNAASKRAVNKTRAAVKASTTPKLKIRNKATGAVVNDSPSDDEEHSECEESLTTISGFMRLWGSKARLISLKAL